MDEKDVINIIRSGRSKQCKDFLNDYDLIHMAYEQKILVEKNISGVISDTVLQEQLHYLELELMNLNSELVQEPNFPVNIDELIDISRAYVKNPSKIWEMANLENKIRLQQFNFPKGITYDGNIFRTPEICRLFKVKSFFYLTCPL